MLIGNGFSRNIASSYAYSSLFKQARKLTKADRVLFDALHTENFEVVLAALSTTMRTLEALESPAAAELQVRYRSVQRALGSAVRDIHLPLRQFPAGSRYRIKRTLAAHRFVFTTNYDLLLYWSAGAGETFSGFTDYFHAEHLSFDPGRTRHGADCHWPDVPARRAPPARRRGRHDQ